MNIQEALHELRKNEKRKFSQSVDLIINLKGIDIRRETFSTIVTLPHIAKEKKICGFLEIKTKLIPTITQQEFSKYKDKNALKNLVKEYDFFFASPKLMPAVATTFGKILGPAGKMPSPQLGLIVPETEERIKQELAKVSKAIKVRMKEPSIKVSVGNESMEDQHLLENIHTLYQGIANALPKKKDNIKNVMLKFTMTKPVKVEIA